MFDKWWSPPGGFTYRERPGNRARPAFTVLLQGICARTIYNLDHGHDRRFGVLAHWCPLPQRPHNAPKYSVLMTEYLRKVDPVVLRVREWLLRRICCR
ncbi:MULTISPECIES: hypothetical protein [Pseudomonas]|uniref:hypothetical protein n=1 Tax=Pseudomonas TaxID=286 RepID=UPI00123790FF|nr:MULTISPECIES: hypothetical protein [Pseudomonas]MDH1573765.1 hypothetical protein [Pseudomonas sp. GD03746]QQE82986.1 hypothetical protein JET17_20550 [Pseudomonas putida]